MPATSVKDWRPSAVDVIHVRSLRRRMRGVSGSILVLGSDGIEYVLKPSPPNSQRLPAVEFTGNFVLRAFGLSVPTCAVLLCDNETLLDEGEHTFQADDLKPLINRAHYGSRLPSRGSVYDFLPTPLYDNCANVNDLGAAWVIDSWLGKQQERQHIYARDAVRKFRAFLIDSKDLTFHSHDAEGPGVSVQAHVAATDRAVIDATIWQIGGVHRSFLAALEDSIPAPWLPGYLDLRTPLSRLIRNAPAIASRYQKLSWQWPTPKHPSHQERAALS